MSDMDDEMMAPNPVPLLPGGNIGEYLQLQVETMRREVGEVMPSCLLADENAHQLFLSNPHWHAISSVQKFYGLREAASCWRLPTFDGKQAGYRLNRSIACCLTRSLGFADH